MEIDPKSIKLNAEGLALVKEQKYAGAVEKFLKAVEISPGYANAYMHLAEAFDAKKQEDEAEQYYRRAIEIDPDIAENHIESGLDTLLTGALGKVVAEYKKAKYADREPAPTPEKADEPVVLLEMGGGAVAAPGPSSGDIDGDEVFDPAEFKKMSGKEEESAETGSSQPESVPWEPTGESQMETLNLTDAGSGDFDPDGMFRTATPASDGPESGMEFIPMPPPEEGGSDGMFGGDVFEIGPEPSADLETSRNEAGVPEPFSAMEEADFIPREPEKGAGESLEQTVAGLIPVSTLIVSKAGDKAALNLRVVAVDQSPLSDRPVSFSLEGDPMLTHYAAFLLPSGQELGSRCQVKSDFTGAVSLYLKMPNKSGTMTCKAKCGEIGTTISVQVESREAKRVKMEASEELPRPGQAVQAIATALDEYDNPIAGEFLTIMIVDCQGEPGELQEQPSAITNQQGQVYATYVPSGNPGDYALLSSATASVPMENIRPVKITTAGDVKEAPRPAAPSSPPPAPAPRAERRQPVQPLPPPQPVPERGVAAAVMTRPTFSVKKGRKTTVDVQAQLPKLATMLALLAVAALVAYCLYFIGRLTMIDSFKSAGTKKNNEHLFEEAIPKFKNCLKLASQDRRCLSGLAYSYKSLAADAKQNHQDDAVRANAREAIRTLEQYISTEEKKDYKAQAQYDIGQCFEWMEDWRQALSAYKKLHAMDPNFTGATDKIDQLEGILNPFGNDEAGGDDEGEAPAPDPER